MCWRQWVHEGGLCNTYWEDETCDCDWWCLGAKPSYRYTSLTIRIIHMMTSICIAYTCSWACLYQFVLSHFNWWFSYYRRSSTKTEEQAQFVASIRRARHDSQFIPVSKNSWFTRVDWKLFHTLRWGIKGCNVYPVILIDCSNLKLDVMGAFQSV